jgi:hypothetical protein
MPDDTPATAVLTLGYNHQKQRCVGTWVGSMMTHLWVNEGTMDATGRVLMLAAEGPNTITEGQVAQYKDVIEIESDGHRVLGDDGAWHGFMVANYQRMK